MPIEIFFMSEKLNESDDIFCWSRKKVEHLYEVFSYYISITTSDFQIWFKCFMHILKCLGSMQWMVI